MISTEYRVKPAPNWCPACGQRPDALTFCAHPFHRLESATTPAEVAPIAWRFDYCGVKPMVWLEKPAENAPMFTNIRALVYADDYATLARQLAEAKAESRDVLGSLVESQNARAHLLQRIAEAESQLAEATRRVAEVEEVLRQIDAYHGPIRTPIHTITKLRGMARAALNKEPAK